MTISFTEQFYVAVRGYQQQHKELKSWTQACLELAAIGYQTKTGHRSPPPFAEWGGKREGAGKPTQDKIDPEPPIDQ